MMKKQSRAEGAQNKGAAGAKGRKPSGGAQKSPHAKFGKTGGTGLKAGVYARMRQGQDVVAFATPVAPVTVKLYAEMLESFQVHGRQPRNFLLILTSSPESDQFDAYQVSYERFEQLLPKAKFVDGERAYWSFTLKSRALTTADGARVELRKLEKRN